MVIYISCAILMVIAFGSLFRELGNRNKNKRLDILSSLLVLISAIALLIYGIFIRQTRLEHAFMPRKFIDVEKNP
ncbi:hypothetical protein ABVB43_12145 [Staphylococcus cohnii]|uniref:hypothetical protein n=1 Tax=Staphylococcus cohnii TaxID=29382 RepID=UPI00374F8CE4